MADYIGVPNETRGEADLITDSFTELISPTGEQATARISRGTSPDSNYLTITVDQDLADGADGNLIKLQTVNLSPAQASVRIIPNSGAAAYTTITVDEDLARGTAGNGIRLSLSNHAGAASIDWDADTNTLSIVFNISTGTLDSITTQVNGLTNQFSASVTGDGTLTPETATITKEFSGGIDDASYDSDSKTLTVNHTSTTTLATIRTAINRLTDQFSATLTGTSGNAESPGYTRDFAGGENHIHQRVIITAEHDCWFALNTDDTAPGNTDTNIVFRKAGQSFFDLAPGYRIWARVSGSTDADASVQIYFEEYELDLPRE